MLCGISGVQFSYPSCRRGSHKAKQLAAGSRRTLSLAAVPVTHKGCSRLVALAQCTVLCTAVGDCMQLQLLQLMQCVAVQHGMQT